MVLKVLSSGSKGNCYVLTDNNGRRLILDVGIQYKKILNGIGYELLSVDGVCVTHCHKDHDLSANEFLLRCMATYRPYILQNSFTKQRKHFGNYCVTAFPLEHDVPCYGFLITHPEMGKMVYITDTAYCKYRFKGVNHILVECNYDERMLSEDYAALGHVLHDHMEIQTTKRFLQANSSDALRNVVLCHLSKENITEKTALDEVNQILPEQTKLYVAKPKLEIEL